ncbi:MAG: arylamine N-acetyltransferase [Cyclobacteriaceae bacterium]
MNIKEYLNRIEYDGEVTPGIAALRELQQKHLLSVPFENLDIHYGRPIQLDTASFYDKIITNKRGGFCYELNGLFQILLNKLGFEAKIISARVYDEGKGTFGEEYDHLVIIVDTDQSEYLVDVGFGEFAFNPLLLEPNKIQDDPRGKFIIEKGNDHYTVSKLKEGSKNVAYRFTDQARALSEFKGMCDYHQTSPHSHFTQKKLISKPTNKGRITLTGNTIKITEGDAVQKCIEFPKEAYDQQLRTWFNMDEMKISSQQGIVRLSMKN